MSVFFCCYAFNLEKGGIGAGVALGTFVAEDATFGIESERCEISEIDLGARKRA